MRRCLAFGQRPKRTSDIRIARRPEIEIGMTLFTHVSPEGSAFEQALERYFEGHWDFRMVGKQGAG